MKRATFATTGVSLAIGGLLVLSPLPLMAQDASQEHHGQTEHMGEHEMGKHGKAPAQMTERRQHHEQMEKMHAEMRQELEQQMTALREHTKTMNGVTEEKQLLTELKKHQQMTDTLLGTMMEQRDKMHARMQQHHGHRHGGVGEDQPEGSGTAPAAK
ncbi:MAG: hypothetical protein EXR78_04555 [Deltaproteobacteria bacterium]|nr:hypothetical protein [Deltaproteobacteria bacterium]